MTSVPEDEVVDAELVDDELLPAVRPAVALAPGVAGRPLVDFHTVLMPGQQPAMPGDGPQYTEADFRVSEDTAARDARKKAENTRLNRDALLERFKTWCAETGRVDSP